MQVLHIRTLAAILVNVVCVASCRQPDIFLVWDISYYISSVRFCSDVNSTLRYLKDVTCSIIYLVMKNQFPADCFYFVTRYFVFSKEIVMLNCAAKV